MSLTYIPKGSMCMVCTHVLDKCDHLMFDEMTPMGKPDDDGFVEVKCEWFIKKEKADA